MEMAKRTALPKGVRVTLNRTVLVTVAWTILLYLASQYAANIQVLGYSTFSWMILATPIVVVLTILGTKAVSLANWQGTRMTFIRFPSSLKRLGKGFREIFQGKIPPPSWPPSMYVFASIFFVTVYFLNNARTTGSVYSMTLAYYGMFAALIGHSVLTITRRRRPQIFAFHLAMIVINAYFFLMMQDVFIGVMMDILASVRTQSVWFNPLSWGDIAFNVIPKAFATRSVDPVEGSMLFLLMGGSAIITIAGNQVIGATFGVVFTFIATSYAVQLAAAGNYSILVDAGRRLGFIGGGKARTCAPHSSLMPSVQLSHHSCSQASGTLSPPIGRSQAKLNCLVHLPLGTVRGRTGLVLFPSLA